MSDSVRPHRRKPTRLPCPWDSPGKNTGVGCHFLLQCMKVKSEREVAQSCPTLSDPMDCSLLQKPLNAPHRSSTALGQCHLGLTHLFPMGHHTFALLRLFPGFPGGSDGKESVCNVGDLGLIPGLGRSWKKILLPLEEGMATHSSILAWRITMDRGAWKAPVHGVTKSQT